MPDQASSDPSHHDGHTVRYIRPVTRPLRDAEPARLVTGRDFAGDLTVGSRSSQQDSYGFADPAELAPGEAFLIVSDGMGGHRGGSVASLTIVEAFFDQWFAAPTSPDRERLVDAMNAANRRLVEKVNDHPDELEGMGATLVAVVLRGLKLRWLSVGDSPLFLYSGHELIRLNEEHSMRRVFAHRVEQGEMSAAQAATHPERNHLLSALTGDVPELVDCPSDPYPVSPGDLIIAATDGILTLGMDEIARVLEIHGAEASAGELTERLLVAVEAKRAPRQDNTTVAIIRVPPQTPPSEVSHLTMP